MNFGNTYGLLSTYFKTRTANIADAGQFRLARADVINWRNQANSGNLSLGVSASDVLQFNGVDLVNTTLASGNIFVGNVSNVATAVAMSGDVAISNTGATTIQNNVVSNAKLAQMATMTIKGNNTGGTANASDLTATQTTAMLNDFVGDSGSGGTKGLVPAPTSGDASKFLKGDGTWTTPPGAGDVVGPASSTDSGFARFDGLTGKLLKNSPATIVNADVASNAAIVYSKLDLANSIVNSDISASAAIAWSKMADLTNSRALVSDGSGDVSVSAVTSTELGYLSGIANTNGGLVYGNGTTLATSSAGTAQNWVLSGGAGAPTMSNTTTRGKTIDGSADEIQLKVQEHSSQTANAFEIENSSATDIFVVGPLGKTTLSNSSGLGTSGSAYHQIWGSLVGQTSSGNAQLAISNSDRTQINANSYRDSAATPKAVSTVTGYSIFDVFRTTTAGGTAFSFVSNYQDAQTANSSNVVTNQVTAGLITGDGSWAIGPNSAANHVIQKNASTAAVVTIRNLEATTASDSASAVVIQKGSTTNTTSQSFILFRINAGGTNSGGISANGANTAAFVTVSDERLKEDIQSLSPQLEKIMSLRPATFSYKDGSGSNTGFIAQEIQQIYPDAVSANEDGWLSITGWDKTDARLVKAIQELKALNDSLEARIKQLENKEDLNG